MKVKELIEELQKLNPELPVWNHDIEQDYEVNTVEVTTISDYSDDKFECCFLRHDFRKDDEG